MRPAVDPLSVCRWLSLPPDDLLRACRQSRYQGSGPGGQKRNRVYSGIRLLHPESGLAVEADARRESRRNLEDALHRLRLEMALSLASVIPGGDAPIPDGAAGVEDTPAFQSPAFRAQASPAHPDFPVFALRAVYLLAKHGGKAAAAAAELGCTASSLARFLKSDKALWSKAREIRAAYGLHPLK
jgi:hypothetical protein